MTVNDGLKYLEFRKAIETISKNHRYRHFVRTDDGIVTHYWLGTHGGLRKGSSPSNSNSIQPVQDEKNRKLLEKFTIVSKLLLARELQCHPGDEAKEVFSHLHDARIAEFKKLL